MTAKLRTGSHTGYRMLDWDTGSDVNLGDVIRKHPQLVLQRCVAIAWSDSDRYHLSAAELAGGWQRVGDLAISPMITDIAQLPTPGFDEWYVFEHMPDRVKLSRFNSAVAFQPFGVGTTAEAFWSQIEALQPVHALLGACPSLSLVTRDTSVFESMFALFQMPSSNVR